MSQLRPDRPGWRPLRETAATGMPGVGVTALLMFVAGCTLGEVTAAEGGDVLVVESHLQAGPQRQMLLLHRSLQEGVGQAAPGAIVTISGPDGVSVPLPEAPLQLCAQIPSVGLEEPFAGAATCYATRTAGDLIVQPGAMYELEVVSPRGERIRGRTTVPGAFQGRRPAIPPSAAFPACSLPPHTNLELIWSQSVGAWSYLASVEISGLSAALAGTGIRTPDRVDLTGLSISQNDTTLVLPAEFGLFELTNLDPDLLVYLQGGFPAGVTARLRLSALDRNYVNAIRGGSFNPSGAIRVSSVVGDGIGVFGSYVPRELFVIVDEESPLPRC